METLENGSTAPDWSLFDQDNENVILSDARGSWAMVFFCDKTEVPSTIAELSALRNAYGDFEALGVKLYAVSLATVEELSTFAREHTIPFPLLFDEKHRIAARYGAYASHGLIIGHGEFRPHAFIVNPEGKIAKIYKDIDLARHIPEVLVDLRELMQTKQG